MKMKDKNIYSVIQRSVATKNPGSIKRMLPRSFASLWMTIIFCLMKDGNECVFDVLYRYFPFHCFF